MEIEAKSMLINTKFVYIGLSASLAVFFTYTLVAGFCLFGSGCDYIP